MLYLLEPLELLESRGIFHGDLKPERIFYMKDQLKILNFGILAIPPEEMRINNIFTKKLQNDMLLYCPPEVFHSQGYNLNKVDVYIWGMCVYALLSRKSPEELEDELNNKMGIEKHDEFLANLKTIKIRNTAYEIFVKEFIEAILVKALDTNPEYRPTFAELRAYSKELFNKDGFPEKINNTSEEVKSQDNSYMTKVLKQLKEEQLIKGKIHYNLLDNEHRELKNDYDMNIEVIKKLKQLAISAF